jgi:hypothetical protein
MACVVGPPHLALSACMLDPEPFHQLFSNPFVSPIPVSPIPASMHTVVVVRPSLQPAPHIRLPACLPALLRACAGPGYLCLRQLLTKVRKHCTNGTCVHPLLCTHSC